MKLKFIYLLLCFMLSFSCNKKAIEVEDLSRFKKIYITQASGTGVFARVLAITDSVQKIQINAGLGGTSPAPSDINLSFEVYSDSVQAYNAKNYTNYQIVPEGSYVLINKSATIKGNDYFSSPIDIEIKTEGFIEPGVSYLLPVGISSASSGFEINQKLKTVYLLITGSYPPGKEPPAKVFDLLGRSLISLVAYQNALILVETNGLFSTYEWSNENQAYGTNNIVPNGGWNIFDKVIGADNRLITRWAGTGILWEYPFDVKSRAISFEGVVRGNNFNAYDIVSYSKAHNALICRKPGGELYLVKKSDILWDQTTLLGDSFSGFTKIEAYQDGFLAVDSQGEMFYYAVNATGLTLGTPQHVGSGWNKYRNILSKESALLAVDNGGLVWQFNFNLVGFWDVR